MPGIAQHACMQSAVTDARSNARYELLTHPMPSLAVRHQCFMQSEWQSGTALFGRGTCWVDCIAVYFLSCITKVHGTALDCHILAKLHRWSPDNILVLPKLSWCHCADTIGRGKCTHHKFTDMPVTYTDKDLALAQLDRDGSSFCQKS